MFIDNNSDKIKYFPTNQAVAQDIDAGDALSVEVTGESDVDGYYFVNVDIEK